MSLPQAAQYWRNKLVDGQPINRVRIRRLLEIAGSERRGLAIVNSIRQTLTVYGLTTDPDFQSGWIDAFVRIQLIDHSSTVSNGFADTHTANTNAEQPSSAEIDPGSDEAIAAGEESATLQPLNTPLDNVGFVETALEPQPDPIARISSIPAANHTVASVLWDDPINTATTLMRFEGYSQLAIMQGQREVRGIISWESIAKRSLIFPLPTKVGDCQVDAQLIDAEGTLFDALPTIEQFGYVLVRARDRTIAGIVTASDLTKELGRLSYAFMSLRTIEILVRKRLHPCLSSTDLVVLEDHSKAKIESDPSLMTFGENVMMLERSGIWTRLNVNVDKPQFIRRLLEIRDIRNDVMHFDPDPLSDSQRIKLKQMEDFLRQIFI